jgi:OOP family OmpA-OmpF porin
MNSIFAQVSPNLKATVTVVLVAVMCVIGSPAALAQQVASQANSSVTESLGEAFAEPKTIAPSVARVIIYRPVLGFAGGVSRVLINKNYHTSLQPGSFSELCLPPGRISLAAQMAQAGDVANQMDLIAVETLNAGQNAYLRLNDQGDNRFAITRVTPSVALAELKNTRRQVHAISRVPNQVECLSVATATAVESRVMKQENVTSR